MCAYFTFVPYVKATCGTYTRRDTIYKEEYRVWDPPVLIVDGCENPRSIENVCAVQPIEQYAGDESKYDRGVPPRTIQGRYMSVNVDCYTGQKLATVVKHDVLGHDGVSLPNDSPYWKTLTEHWRKTADQPEWITFDESQCRFKGKRADGYTPDCVDAISSLRRSADFIFSSHKITTVADFGECVIRAQLDPGSNIPDCQYNYLELAMAVEIGRRGCKTWTLCAKWPLYDKGNGCHGWVTITKKDDKKCW